MLSARAKLPTATDLINVQFIRRISTISVASNLIRLRETGKNPAVNYTNNLKKSNTLLWQVNDLKGHSSASADDYL